MINLRDQLIMEQPLKFCLNGGEKDKLVFENAFKEKTGNFFINSSLGKSQTKEKKGILSFSSRLYLKEVDEIKITLEKEYSHYQFCYVQEIGCAEIGFSRREIN